MCSNTEKVGEFCSTFQMKRPLHRPFLFDVAEVIVTVSFTVLSARSCKDFRASYPPKVANRGSVHWHLFCPIWSCLLKLPHREEHEDTTL